MIIQEFGDNSSCSKCFVKFFHPCVFILCFYVLWEWKNFSKFSKHGLNPKAGGRLNKWPYLFFHYTHGHEPFVSWDVDENCTSSLSSSSGCIPEKGLPKAQDLLCQALSAAGQSQWGRNHLTSSPEQDNDVFSSAKQASRSQSRGMWKLPQCSGHTLELSLQSWQWHWGHNPAGWLLLSSRSFVLSNSLCMASSSSGMCWGNLDSIILEVFINLNNSVILFNSNWTVLSEVPLKLAELGRTGNVVPGKSSSA